MPWTNLAGWAITGFILLAMLRKLAPEPKGDLRFSALVYFVNFLLPLGFCVLNGYWIAVFAGIATVVAAFLFFGSGKASHLHQTASPELYGQPRYFLGVRPGKAFSIGRLHLKMRFSQCYISGREKSPRRRSSGSWRCLLQRQNRLCSGCRLVCSGVHDVTNSVTQEMNLKMTRLLDAIDTPKDLRRLSVAELSTLATEVREEVISIVSEVGGHFASTLGAVELTLALHYVFDTPEDRIVWDTGHQAYAHKLICGRRTRLATIRQLDGLSGFLSREESEYDVFGAGHAGTSISAALGMVEANSLAGPPDKVVAVISDGGLSAGLTFEGLNQAGHLDKDLIVVLNDNAIFIDPRVGAVSSFLSKQFTTDFGVRIQKQLSSWLLSLPKRTRP